MKVILGGAPPLDRGLLLRVLDYWPLGYGAGNNFGFVASPGGTRFNTASLLSQGSGGTVASVWGAEGILLRFTGAVAEAVLTGNDLQFPWTATPSLTATPRRYLRYVAEYDYYRTNNIAQESRHGWSSGVSFLAGGVNNLGFQLASASGVVGGNWQLQVRRAQGAGIVTLLDTGVPATQRTRWRWEYVDGPTKRLTISANGEVVGVVDDPANFPAYVGYLAGESFGRSRFGLAANAIGGLDYLTRFLYEIWQNGGWE